MPSLYTRQAQRKLLAEAGMGYINLGERFSVAVSNEEATGESMPSDAQVSNSADGLDTSEEIPNEIKDVLGRMVPRDRIELPTRGFSIRCSTD